MNFGTNLRNLRVQRNLTQQKLADEIGISQASVGAYEIGTREPSFETVKRFADFFGVAPSTLMPFVEVSDEEYVQRVADSLHKNPKLGLLFDKTSLLSDSDLDAVLNVVSAIVKERE